MRCANLAMGRIICLSTPFGRVGFFFMPSPTQEWERISARAEDLPHIESEFLAREPASGRSDFAKQQGKKGRRP
jgi:hypothetical protein